MKEKRKHNFFKRSKEDIFFDIFNYAVLGIITVLVL